VSQTALTPPQGDEVHLWMAPSPSPDPANPWKGGEGDRPPRLFDRKNFETHDAAATVLARYLAIPPQLVSLKCNRFGKPRLAFPPGSNHPDLRFNVSHAPGLSIVAVTCDRDIGVDLESLTRPPAALPGAIRYFHPAEQAALKQFLPCGTARSPVPESYRLLPLLQCWTSKEAFIKGIGQGMRTRLNAFEVNCNPTLPPNLL
jgi:4'-phosphopantetheinyl transferase